MSNRAERTSAAPLSEFLTHEARHAIHDIRQKLFEEAWFGRVVTAEPVIEVSRDREAERGQTPTFEDLWGRSPHNREPAAPERSVEREIDR